MKTHFDEFWEAYDYKKGKQAALKVWKRKKLDHKAQAVISGARHYAQTRGSDPRYWKHPQGWLNDGRWEDCHLPPDVDAACVVGGCGSGRGKISNTERNLQALAEVVNELRGK